MKNHNGDMGKMSDVFALPLKYSGDGLSQYGVRFQEIENNNGDMVVAEHVGMEKDDAIAAVQAINSHDSLVAQVELMKEVLFDIKHTLGANPNESSEALFDKCANAFKIAEDAQLKLKS